MSKYFLDFFVNLINIEQFQIKIQCKVIYSIHVYITLRILRKVMHPLVWYGKGQ